MFKSRTGRIKKYVSSFDFVGICCGSILLWFSLTPSLLPRGWAIQGLISGICFVFGYGFGALLKSTLSYLGLKIIKINLRVKFSITILIIVATFLSFIFGYIWQNEVRQLVGINNESLIYIPGSIVTTVAISILLIGLARSAKRLYFWIYKKITFDEKPHLSIAMAMLTTTVLLVGVFGGALGFAKNITETAFININDTTPEGIINSNKPELSGSDDSLISWNSLGKEGRKFIGSVTEVSKISEFNKSNSSQPIRIYAGLKTSNDTKKRAEIAVADLERAGGFGRKIIVIATSTGTGYIDEQGIKPIEYMYNGDSAIVSMQYSYMPSWISFLIDQDKAKAAGTTLFEEVNKKVQTLPVDKRPKIVVFGESLGSFGSESIFNSVENFTGLANGALWVGPPSASNLWRYATDNRDNGSYQILPVYKDGEILRFANKSGDLNSPNTNWKTPRATYLQHPSDPIVWWNPELIFKKPDWFIEPAGYDASGKIIWLPLISFIQISGDMAFSTSVPAGHGHNYGTQPTEAWGYILPPGGWTTEKTLKLQAALQ